LSVRETLTWLLIRWSGGALVATLAFASAAAAGSAPASLTCQSARAPVVTLRGWIPADELVLDVTLARGASTRRLQFDQGDVPHVVADFRHGVFVLVVVLRVGPDLKLRALPATVRATVGSDGTRASFQALLTAPDPAHTGPVTAREMLFDVPVSCTYVYETP
jgi:hypothetical protein